VEKAPSRLAARAAQQDQLLRDELAERIGRALPVDGTVEPLAGLYLQRVSVGSDAIYGVADPSFCVIAQGSKVMLMGDHRVQYDPAHYLLATAEVPVTGAISDATPAHPYLSLRLTIDPGLVGAVMVESRQPAPRTAAAVRALAVSPLDASLLEAVVRLVRLVDAPTTAAFLAPLITREIIYRLLLGAQGDRLRQIAVFGGATQRIAAAIARIRQDVTQPLRIAELAQEVGMSVSGFHAHFKAVTAMSPGQFQTQLRLQEARRLLLGEHLDAASAGARVGYADAAYFTRAYKRQFGAPPIRDVTQARDVGRAGGTR
jgi:AraC-like DNA-binding protein